MSKFTITLTVETKYPVAVDALRAALGNIGQRLRAEQRINWVLEQLVKAEGVDWFFHVREVLIDETQT